MLKLRKVNFPNPLAIRGKTPEDELQPEEVPTGPGAEVVDEDDNFTRGRVPLPSTGSGTRSRTRVRIVPTGNRARRPIGTSGSGRDPEPSEEPRASLSNSNRYRYRHTVNQQTPSYYCPILVYLHNYHIS